MVTGSRSIERSIPQSGGSTVTGTEEGRAFFQKRLGGFGLCMFALAGGTWLVSATLFLLMHSDGSDGYSPISPSGLMHLTPGLLGGALWLFTRRGKHAGPLLHGLDWIGSLLINYVMIVGGGFSPEPIVAFFVAVLCFNTGMLARAIVVPSTARRTLWIGLIVAVPVLGVAVMRASSTNEAIGAVVQSLCWISVGLVMGVTASHTIFGLRREVQQAKVLGQYTLESKIGEGGMGQVWRASHALLRRPTAIKLLPASRVGEKAIQRFEREVQLTARLTDPHTVAIYDYGRTRDGIFYYAMELLQGIDLERLVKEHGPQPAERVVHILTQVASALAEAHDLGLVHRDIKPANIVLSPRSAEHEFVKVVDFGLVKTIETAADNASGLTAVNTLTGTPLYMAPEAIQSPEAVEGRTDLYSLGAVAWYLLVGRPPFEGKTIVEICGHHLHTPPLPPSVALGSDVPRDVEDAILACLEKRPDARPANARALRKRLLASSAAGKWSAEQAIEWWQHREPSHAPPASVERTIAVAVGARREPA
jgi:eukaryotic-like serine/threonine-protein kinase